MKTEQTNNKNSNDPKLDLEFLLRTNGFLFPETVNEVSEYERTFGDTDIILPDDMQEPTFLEKALSRFTATEQKAGNELENYALAARQEKGNELPDYIKKKMDEDRDNIKG